MSKYAPLKRYLEGQPATTSSLALDFRQIEEVLGSNLPPAARTYTAWWGNNPQRHTQAVWLTAGWETRDVHIHSRHVTFVRASNSQRGRQSLPAQASPGTIGGTERHQQRAAQQGRGPEPLASTRELSGYGFAQVCLIQPGCDRGGQPREYLPQRGYRNARSLPLHRYGAGPFCRFRIPANLHVGGVYLLALNDSVCYVGECESLSARFNMGYGQISPRNCYKGGQQTNCRVNHLILQAVKAEHQVELWFYQTADRRGVESALLRQLAPPWNSQGKL